MIGPLTQRVSQACDRAVAELPPGEDRDCFSAIRSSLQEPLRVAVAGRVKAGKSTLVNALLRQRVAPTGVGECTKLVTWFRYGVPERVEVRLRDGRQRTVPLTAEGALPEDLGGPVEGIVDLEVRLSNDTLRSLTLIDTPGLSSANDEVSRTTAHLLALDSSSRTAVAQADALVLVTSLGIRQDDVDVLTGFQALFGGMRASALNAVGLLSKADKLGDDEPWKAAGVIAERYRRNVRNSVVDIIPVIGLLAETAEAGVFTEQHASALRGLAALPAARRQLMLLSTDRFVTADCAVPTAERTALLEALDLYGIAKALELLDAGTMSARGLVEELRQLSGIEEVRRMLEDSFACNSDAIKADGALTMLERRSFQPVDSANAEVLRRLRNDLEEIRLAPETHQLNETRALNELATGAVDLPPELADDLRRLAINHEPAAKLGLSSSAGPADHRARALQGVARWKAFGNDGRAAPRQRWVADVACRSYETLWARASRVEAASG